MDEIDEVICPKNKTGVKKAIIVVVIPLCLAVFRSIIYLHHHLIKVLNPHLDLLHTS